MVIGIGFHDSTSWGMWGWESDDALDASISQLARVLLRCVDEGHHAPFFARVVHLGALLQVGFVVKLMVPSLFFCVLALLSCCPLSFCVGVSSASCLGCPTGCPSSSSFATLPVFTGDCLETTCSRRDVSGELGVHCRSSPRSALLLELRVQGFLRLLRAEDLG